MQMGLLVSYLIYVFYADVLYGVRSGRRNVKHLMGWLLTFNVDETEQFFSPKGWHSVAQGNALGCGAIRRGATNLQPEGLAQHSPGQRSGLKGLQSQM